MQVRNKKGKPVSFERSEYSSKCMTFTSGHGSFCSSVESHVEKHSGQKSELHWETFYTRGRKTPLPCTGAPGHKMRSLHLKLEGCNAARHRRVNTADVRDCREITKGLGRPPEQRQESQKLKSQAEELFILICLSKLSLT